jgi:hypothetical protein
MVSGNAASRAGNRQVLCERQLATGQRNGLPGKFVAKEDGVARGGMRDHVAEGTWAAVGVVHDDQGTENGSVLQRFEPRHEWRAVGANRLATRGLWVMQATPAQGGKQSGQPHDAISLGRPVCDTTRGGIGPGAQIVRSGFAGPVGRVLGGMSSPAA